MAHASDARHQGHPRARAATEWVHEVKWDGMRVLAEVARRAAADVQPQRATTSPSPGPSSATSPLGDRDLLLDGEVIALNEHGLPDFRVLQDRMHVRNAADRAPAVAAPSR